MDRWFLLIATLLAAIGGIWGMISVHRGTRSHWTVVWMVAVLLCQLGFLSIRGQLRSACPLHDLGEMLVFLAWSLTLFYLLIGPAYRISLLGVFSAPLVFLLQSAALIAGLLTTSSTPDFAPNIFHSLHSAISVLAYGVLALAGVASIMFLVLDRQLKVHRLKSGLFRNLPPAHELLVSVERLLWLGTALLTLGIIAGFLMPPTTPLHSHLVVALAVWVGYAVLLAVKTLRGLTGRKLALATVALFILSLVIFARI